MNPYGRFQIVSGAISGAVVLGGFGFLARNILTVPLTQESLLAFAGLTAAAVVIWYTLNCQIMPAFLSGANVRSRVLSAQNIEGTWIQAERSDTGLRIAVIGIRPAGDGFSMSGYAMDEMFDVVSNISLDFAKFDYPHMAFKFSNTLVAINHPAREGFAELQFEAGTNRPLRFNGSCRLNVTAERYAIEGVRLTDPDELEMLETLEGREDLIDRYWELFFDRQERRAERMEERRARRESRRANRLARAEARERNGKAVSPANRLNIRVEEAFQATGTGS